MYQAAEAIFYIQAVKLYPQRPENARNTRNQMLQEQFLFLPYNHIKLPKTKSRAQISSIYSFDCMSITL